MAFVLNDVIVMHELKPSGTNHGSPKGLMSLSIRHSARVFSIALRVSSSSIVSVI
jgi:hypothetical protein